MTCLVEVPGGLLICDLEHGHTGDHHDPATGQHWAIESGRHVTFTIRSAGGHQ